MMKASDIANIRLQNQQVTSTNLKSVKELVNWMGAMQAQDFNQAKWAIGVRLPHLTEVQIESAFNSGEIIRTHLMRPTWHFVSADDIYWLLELTSKQIKSVMKGRNRELELTEDVLKKSQEVMVKSLEGNRALTRDELSIQLNQAGIKTNDQRLPHILMEAEIDQIICSGTLKGKKQTYALLAERVPNKIELSTDEALALLAKKYFMSHCPATLPDFIWWSGLPVSQARKAIALNDKNLFSETLNGETYWFADHQISTSPLPDSAFLLPAFDEYLVSYKNREAAIGSEDLPKAVSKNGIFWPITVINGQISGLWKKTAKKDTITIEVDAFRVHSSTEKKMLKQAAKAYEHFSGQNTVITF